MGKKRNAKAPISKTSSKRKRIGRGVTVSIVGREGAVSGGGGGNIRNINSWEGEPIFRAKKCRNGGGQKQVSWAGIPARNTGKDLPGQKDKIPEQGGGKD